MESHTTAQSDRSGQPLVRIEGLGVRFGRNEVLRDIDLDDPARPDAGGHRRERLRQDGAAEDDHRPVAADAAARSRFDGRNLAELSEKELTRQRIRFGFLFQQAALFDSMTIAQNVAFPLRQHTAKRRSGDPARSCSPGWPRSGLPESVLGKKPAELSGGMRKRVGLARALALEPEMMLYDEPTTGLDPIMSDVINELILSTRRQHPVTSIVVTHDMRTAQKVADRVVMLYPLARLRPDEPQVIFDGPPEADRIGRRPPRVAVRPRRGGRATDGNATTERRGEPWTIASCNFAWA